MAVSIYSTRTMRNIFYDETKVTLLDRSRFIQYSIEHAVSGTISENLSSPEKLIEICDGLGELSSTRITVVLVDGTVVVDSEKNPDLMDNHSDRPEIISATSGDIGTSTRFSNTLQRKMLYVALPVHDKKGIVAVVRTSTPIKEIRYILNSFYIRIAIAGFIITLFAAWLSLLHSRRITAPLEEMRLGAERYAGGDLSGRLKLKGSEEISALSEAMNRMAIQLEERIRTILHQRREQKAVYSSMSDAVIAVSAHGFLISINDTAAKLLNINQKLIRGKALHEVIKDIDLRLFISKALRTVDGIEEEIILFGEDELYLQAQGRPLRDEDDKSMGAVVVLNDITDIRKMEKTRRDFVANVSHELKTPVTSIKGFTEMLRDGAFDEKDNSERFLEIIARQADRLDAIINDLLSLARIERAEERNEIILSDGLVNQVVNNAVLSMRPQAEANGVEITVDNEKDISADINYELLEQAVTNLLDNAIKYSGSGKLIHIKVEKVSRQISIVVSDQGSGIEAEHLPRLFERFYRVDKGRSREAGGTGLGLSIVKHILQAHNGSVDVTSEIGKGSSFSLLLPSNEPLVAFE
jgi:two-component system, OmpR family, phosphate regulon sensor histidine kinase PhoR